MTPDDDWHTVSLPLSGTFNNAPLEFILDGNPGEKVLLDNIVFPGIQNGNFLLGGLDSWTATVSPGGSAGVQVVPEPSSLAAWSSRNARPGILWMAKNNVRHRKSPGICRVPRICPEFAPEFAPELGPEAVPGALLDHRQRRGDLAERGADLDAGDAVADAGDGLAGDLDAHGQLGLAAFDRGHPPHDRLGNRHAGHLVVHERRVAVTRQRPDARDDRDAATPAARSRNRSRASGSKTGCVMANSAPASTLRRKRSSSFSWSSAVGSRPTPITA